jgi:C_GCAxxG_C_C family probable redox protein
MSEAEKACELFAGGCACSQAVFGAFAPGLGLDEETAVRLSAGFAGGMRTADVCGAVTGAYMALGLANTANGCRSAEARGATYQAMGEFRQAFVARHGSIVCRELLGCDISTPGGSAEATAKNLFATRCRDLVGDAAEIVAELVSRESPQA